LLIARVFSPPCLFVSCFFYKTTNNKLAGHSADHGSMHSPKRSMFVVGECKLLQLTAMSGCGCR
jgi:hypothetical protein